ncbi:hypothetical protein [Haloprofundus salinisoli]|uniref:hypothetical protein n=1 Tax=Haloprofundus salinisoli TaxID=2876193 RepID=UPI001CCEE40D|nr:hypothetical protein [Haloprofundus salinisoli]
MAPSRRTFLRSTVLVTTSLIAGCTAPATDGSDDADSPENETPTETRTSTPSESATDAPENEPFVLPESSVRTVGDVRIAVANPAVRKAAVYESIMGSGGVLAPTDRQFVVAAVQHRERVNPDVPTEPPYDAFELVVDGETHPAVEIEERTTGAYTTSFADRGRFRYDGPPIPKPRTVGWVAFEPPSPLDADEATIRCRHDGDAAEWSLPGDAVTELGRRAPTFELRSFEAEVGSAGLNVELSLVVENTSDVDGEFLAAVYWPTTGIADDDESTIVRENVDPTGRVEWTQRFSTEYSGDANGQATASVDGMVSASETVDLDTESTTPTETTTITDSAD